MSANAPDHKRRTANVSTAPRAPEEPLVELDPAAITAAYLQEAGLRNVRLTHADLANIRARGALISQAELYTCRLTGIQLAESTLRDVVITNSRVDLAAFRMSTLERVVFRNCRLEELDLVQAKLSSVVFDTCTMIGADIRQATFRRSQIRDCTLDGLVGVGQLRGVSMPWADVVGLAGTFAEALGIGVIEDNMT